MRSAFPRFSPEWWGWMTTPEPNTGCHLWTGAVCRTGYGRVAYRGRAGGVLVHRIRYELLHGPVASSRVVCHRCDTPSCVNPDHLFLGSQKENMRDMFAKGRANPRGTHRPRRDTAVATVAVRELALAGTHASGGSVDELHLMRNGAMLAQWRQVAGVPKRRPTMALVPYNCPPQRTLEPSIERVHGLRDVATVALSCGGAA